MEESNDAFSGADSTAKSPSNQEPFKGKSTPQKGKAPIKAFTSTLNNASTSKRSTA